MMTKDEAIKIIKTEMECVRRPDCDRLACAYCDLAMREEDILTAYQMAITALQADGDCISRQCALDDIETVDPSMLLDVNWVKNWVKTLPSVQSDNSCDGCKYEDADDGVIVPCGFCMRSHSDNYDMKGEPMEPINRQDAIRIVDSIDTWQAGWRGNAIESLKALPSVQPEIIRCKDCKWFGKVGCSVLIVDDSDKPTENDYCSFAERRTDE